MRRDPRLFALACVLLGGMGEGVVSPRLPEFLRGESELAWASGLAATVMYAGIFISTFQYGKWSDRGWVHRLLGPALLAYAATLLGMAWLGGQATAFSERAFFALRLAEGLALSAIFVSADFLLGRLSESKVRAQWLSYYGVALSVGLVLGPLAALLLSPQGQAPARALACVAALGLVLAVPAFGIRVPAAPPAGAPPRLDRRALSMAVVYGFMEAGMVAVFPALAVSDFHLVPEVCLIVVIVVAAAASLMWGWLGDRNGPRAWLPALMIALIIGPAALALLGGQALISAHAAGLGTALLFGVLAGGIYPLGFAWLLQTLPEAHYGHGSGGFARGYGLGSLFGPLALGAAAQHWGALGMWAVLAGLGVAGICALGFNRQ